MRNIFNVFFFIIFIVFLSWNNKKCVWDKKNLVLDPCEYVTVITCNLQSLKTSSIKVRNPVYICEWVWLPIPHKIAQSSAFQHTELADIFLPRGIHASLSQRAGDQKRSHAFTPLPSTLAKNVPRHNLIFLSLDAVILSIFLYVLYLYTFIIT